MSKVWGFYRRQGQLPEAAALAEALGRVGSEHVQLDDQQQTIRFEKPGMELNLGSIGKGYALDRAAEILTAAGVDDFLLHGGQSSILARGSRGSHADAGWLVSIGDPLRQGKQLAQVRLRDRSMGTSARERSSFDMADSVMGTFSIRARAGLPRASSLPPYWPPRVQRQTPWRRPSMSWVLSLLWTTAGGIGTSRRWLSAHVRDSAA